MILRRGLEAPGEPAIQFEEGIGGTAREAYCDCRSRLALRPERPSFDPNHLRSVAMNVDRDQDRGCGGLSEHHQEGERGGRRSQPVASFANQNGRLSMP